MKLGKLVATLNLENDLITREDIIEVALNKLNAGIDKIILFREPLKVIPKHVSSIYNINTVSIDRDYTINEDIDFCFDTNLKQGRTFYISNKDLSYLKINKNEKTGELFITELNNFCFEDNKIVPAGYAYYQYLRENIIFLKVFFDASYSELNEFLNKYSTQIRNFCYQLGNQNISYPTSNKFNILLMFLIELREYQENNEPCEHCEQGVFDEII